MTPSTPTTRKKYGLILLAVVLLLLGGIAFFFEPHNYMIRSLGLLAILGSVPLVRTSRVHSRDPVPADGEWIDLTAPGKPSHAMWFIGIALLVLAGISLLLMGIDARHGGHSGWPVYLFAGVALACAGVWSAIIAKLRN